MTAIRVVLGDVPRLLYDILQGTLGSHSDMELFQSADVDLSNAVARCGAEVVIVASPTGGATPLQRLVLVDHPDLTMFVVTDDARAAHQLEWRQTPVVEVSPTGLVEAIRAAVAISRREHGSSGATQP